MRAQGLALEPFLPQLFAVCWCEGADGRGLLSPAIQSLVLGSGGNPPPQAVRAAGTLRLQPRTRGPLPPLGAHVGWGGRPGGGVATV